MNPPFGFISEIVSSTISAKICSSFSCTYSLLSSRAMVLSIDLSRVYQTTHLSSDFKGAALNRDSSDIGSERHLCVPLTPVASHRGIEGGATPKLRLGRGKC